MHCKADGRVAALRCLHSFGWAVCMQAASAELRETAAEGLGELVDITSEETLKPFVVQITGQLPPHHVVFYCCQSILAAVLRGQH